jgi:hydrogenase maturation protein HypF
MALEAAALVTRHLSRDPNRVARASEHGGEPHGVIDPGPLLSRAVAETLAGRPAGAVALQFHREVAGTLAGTALALARRYRVGTVCFSGGSFLNRLLHRGMTSLTRRGLRVFFNREIPPGDGGIALGQAVAPTFRLTSKPGPL